MSFQAQLEPVKAFFKHNNENERGRRDVHRSSCVFYFTRSPSIRTQVLFMNYWREKRNLAYITMRTTIRSMDGEEILKRTSKIEALGSHVIEINELLDSLSAPQLSQGSVEVEFTSESNLAIAYPAAVVRYIGPDWHTIAHTSQRYYSEDSGDDLDNINRIQEAEEGNITIHGDSRMEPFFIVHNGATAVPPSDMDIRITSANGLEKSATVAGLAWKPFQTRFFRLRDMLDYRNFLGEDRGTFSLKFFIAGVFPRIIAGSEMEGTWSIDHTNFSATSGPATSDVIKVNGDSEFKDLVFNLPNNFEDGWECFADIYPTYPDDNYDVLLRKLDVSGETLSSRSIRVVRGTKEGFPRITLEKNLDKNEACNYELVFRHATSLPRRFHMGIHYRVQGGNPGFMTDGPIPHTTAPIRTRWFPVFEGENCKNYLLIANRTAGYEKPSDVAFEIKLFNSYGDEPLRTKFMVMKNQSKCVRLEDLFQSGVEFMGSRPGWIYMIAEKPQRCVVHYASTLGDKSIAVCHGF